MAEKTETEYIEDVDNIADAFRQEGVADLDLGEVLPTFDKPWFRYSYLLKLNFLLCFSLMSSTNSGFDGSMLNGLQIIPNWSPYFHGVHGIRLGVLTCGTNFGGIVGSFAGNWLSDNLGRRHPTGIGSLLVVIGVIVQTSSQNYGAFFAGRFIIGIGVTICGVVGPLALSELSYPTHRPVVTTSFNILWMMGSLLASGATWGCFHIKGASNWSWRGPSLLQAFFPVLQLAMWYWAPESPRYLVSKGRIDEARDILAKYHAGGDRNHKLVEFELAQITIALDNERSLKSVSIKEFFITKQNLHRLFIICFLAFITQCSGNGLLAYYLSLILNSIGITSANQQLTISFGINVYGLGIALLSLILVDRFKRRQIFLFSTIGMLVTYVIWTVVSAINQKRDFNDKPLGKAVLAMIFLFQLCYLVGLCGLPYLYYTEILPYYMRSKGMFVVQCVVSLSSIFNGLVNPVAMDAISWKYYILYCCIIGVEVFVVFFFFPETKGYTLEEAAEAFGDTVVTEKRKDEESINS